MLRLTICLLAVKTAFAANAFPIDTDSYRPIGPNTNLVFNFEQIRQDQPPQIEMREENIHKYRNRPSTTTPTPIDNGDMSPIRRENPVPYTAAQWDALQTAPKYDGPVSNWKSVPAPPSFPHWDSLANKGVASRNNFNSYDHKPQPIVVEEAAHWHGPEMRGRALPAYVPSIAVPVTTTQTVPVESYSSRRGPSRRGQHKFNWNELSTELPTTVPSVEVNVPTTASSRMPPPPVPTLSPWYDGF